MTAVILDSETRNRRTPYTVDGISDILPPNFVKRTEERVYNKVAELVLAQKSITTWQSNLSTHPLLGNSGSRMASKYLTLQDKETDLTQFVNGLAMATRSLTAHLPSDQNDIIDQWIRNLAVNALHKIQTA
jgi:hypothetical protein